MQCSDLQKSGINDNHNNKPSRCEATEMQKKPGIAGAGVRCSSSPHLSAHSSSLAGDYFHQRAPLVK